MALAAAGVAIFTRKRRVHAKASSLRSGWEACTICPVGEIRRAIKPEIQKLTAIRTLSPLLPLPPLFFYCHCQTHNLPLPTSHFRFTNQSTKSPLSTSSIATSPSAAAAAAAAYYSPAPEPNLDTQFEVPTLNVESLRESYDDGKEDDRSLIFTCVSEDGTCKVYVVPTKHSSQELCGEVVEVITYVRPQVVATRLYPAYASMLEWLKRNPKVVNMLEVHPRDDFHVASEELKKYGGKGGLSEQVANILEVCLGRGFRVAYEKAMDYGIKVMVSHFPLQVALCNKKTLVEMMNLIEASLTFEQVRFIALDLIMLQVLLACGIVDHQR
ncbi:uncharacterized protein LOC125315838 [Rhodamnia argentea]|uniref:Uncharacterized protein LOC125315838 n=1 Tax=Rhodamnia argentea TaxID=178133 RepID=A0ABM3HMF1_9MYRT|nr:uncharacterized protein LOC125315838 [Rhodamnia argentea]